MRLTGCLVLSVSALAMSMPALASPQADLRDYALASCLIKQNASPVLKTEGYRLADVVLARTGASPLAWRSLDTAVGTALARRGMVLVHVDGPVAQATQPAPLASCLLVIESRSVESAMQKLVRKAKR